jgi:hypothetical protein
VNALERFIYPEWYAACFVANPTNASMWGAYGEGHRGVRLKFKTNPDTNGLPKLDLYRAIGKGGGTGVPSVTHFGYVPHSFEKMNYTADYPEIDFFQSFGIIPRYKLPFWYQSSNGELSSVSSDVLRESESWRDAYWCKFKDRRTTKTSEWAQEGSIPVGRAKHINELRLIDHRLVHFCPTSGQ